MCRRVEGLGGISKTAMQYLYYLYPKCTSGKVNPEMKYYAKNGVICRRSLLLKSFGHFVKDKKIQTHACCDIVIFWVLSFLYVYSHHSILECYNLFSGVELSMRSFCVIWATSCKCETCVNKMTKDAFKSPCQWRSSLSIKRY